jgi:predicted NBD/HSP70 family sugar kinase
MRRSSVKATDETGTRSPAIRGVGPEELRRHNLSTLLGHVHLSGPASRSELTQVTGLNRSTIGDLVVELSELGLIEEGRSPVAGRGRPSPLVRLRPEGAVVLAVELAVDSIAVATVGLGGHLYNRVRVARPRGRFSPSETVEDVVKLSQPLIASLPVGHLFAGVGVAVVGITRRSDGFVHLAPNLGWRDVALGEMISSALEVPGRVRIANEADLGALGEHRRGQPPRVDDLVYVSGEVGIGVGVIVGGKPLLGVAGYAGEAGHMLVNPTGVRCRCGAVGCWETEAGELALIRRTGISNGTTGLGIIDEITSRAEAGDEAILEAISGVGGWLGLGIGDLINIFNPRLVALGGLFGRLHPLMKAGIAEGVESRALQAPGALCEVVPSSLGVDAPLIGAAELILSETIADPSALRRQDGRE